MGFYGSLNCEPLENLVIDLEMSFGRLKDHFRGFYSSTPAVSLTAVAALANIPDAVTTAAGVLKYGTSIELNPLARYIMEYSGAVNGIAEFKLAAIPLIFGSSILLYNWAEGQIGTRRAAVNASVWFGAILTAGLSAVSVNNLAFLEGYRIVLPF